jgi:HEAT repeat protein
MWELFLIPALGFSLRAGLAIRRHRQQQREWAMAAESLGLRVEETFGSREGRPMVRVRDGQLQVQILAPSYPGQGPQIVIAAPWPANFNSILIRPERKKPPGAPEIEIGDGLFDHAFYIVGPPQLMFALLDAETRRLMITFPRSSLYVGAELSAEAGPLGLTETLRLLLQIARRLAQPLDVARRLAENAHSDPSVEVRLRNLFLLIRERPGEAVTAEALRAACEDPSPRVRLHAAKVLGKETHGLLIELAESQEDDTASAQAIAALGRELPLERTRAILARALGRRLLQTAHACLEALGDSGAREDFDILTKVLTRETSELAAAAAQALGAAGSPDAEPVLLAALKQPSVRVAAAKALGRAGTPAAVLPLKEAAEQTRDPELRSAVRQAVAEIQSRLQGASPGQLSLAGEEAGKLSLAEAEAGQLALAAEEGSPPPAGS